jgi:hypothetical protein
MRALTRHVIRRCISTEACPSRGFLSREWSPRASPPHGQRRGIRHAAALEQLKSSFGSDTKIPTISRIVEGTTGTNELGREGNGYTAAYAMFEGLWEAEVRNCFVNVVSDHPSVLEAFVKGKRERPGKSIMYEVCMMYY